MVIRDWTFQVEGYDPTPDGYHDHLLYEGDSRLAAARAFIAGRRNGMIVKLTMRDPKPK